MAAGALKGTLQATAAAITNPVNATGSVAVVVGDLVVCLLGERTSLTVTAVGPDNLGNTYTAQNVGSDGGNATGRMFWSRVTVAGTITSIPATTTASTNDVAFAVQVIEGPVVASPLDANPANILNDITSPFACPPTGVLTQNDEIIVSGITSANSATMAATSPNLLSLSISSAGVGSTGSVGAALGRQVVASTASVAPAFTAGTSIGSSTLHTMSFKISVGGGTNGNASGSTITETASIISGAATGGAAGAGATLTDTASIISGTASANASAAGSTVTETVSIIGGTASSAVNGNASGSTITETVSVISGAATGTATIAGATLTETETIIAGTAAANANASGATLPETVSILSGAAAGTATVAGQTLSLVETIAAGAVAGEAAATGATLTETETIIPGVTAGAAGAAGVTLTDTVSIISGVASAGDNANASGVTIAETVSLIDGVVSGNAIADGQVISLTETIISGSTEATAEVTGFVIAETISIVNGSISGTAEISGVILEDNISIIPGQAAGDPVEANASGSTIQISIEFIPGLATAIVPSAGIATYYIPFPRKPKPPAISKDAKAYGVILGISIHLIAGEASGSALASGSVVAKQSAILPGKPTGWSYYPGRAVGWSFYPGRASGNARVRGSAMMVRGLPFEGLTPEVELDHIKLDNNFLMVAWRDPKDVDGEIILEQAATTPRRKLIKIDRTVVTKHDARGRIVEFKRYAVRK